MNTNTYGRLQTSFASFCHIKNAHIRLIDVAGVSACRCAEEKKRVANNAKLGWICVPLVTESYAAGPKSSVLDCILQ